MAHIHRTGPVMPKQYPVALDGSDLKVNDIEVGDLVAFESGELVPATAFTWNTDIATTRLDFAAAFAGIASGASDADKPDDTRDHKVLVTQDGECEFDVASATYLPGDLLTVTKAAGNALTNGMEKTVIPNAAIARVSESSDGVAVTRIRGYLLKTAPKRASSTDAIE